MNDGVMAALLLMDFARRASMDRNGAKALVFLFLSCTIANQYPLV